MVAEAGIGEGEEAVADTEVGAEASSIAATEEVEVVEDTVGADAVVPTQQNRCDLDVDGFLLHSMFAGGRWWPDLLST